MTVSGFTIDRTVMDNLLLKWFGGNYLDIIEWKEKAKKWNDFIDKNQLLVSQERLNELKEKAHYCETHHKK